MCHNSSTKSTSLENGWHWSMWPTRPTIKVSDRPWCVIECGDHGATLGVNLTKTTISLSLLEKVSTFYWCYFHAYYRQCGFVCVFFTLLEVIIVSTIIFVFLSLFEDIIVLQNCFCIFWITICFKFLKL